MEAISEIGKLEGHGDFVTTAAFSPDGRFILSGSADRTMRLWEVATQHEIQRFEDHVKNTVWGVSFSPTGRRILASCTDGSIHQWDLKSGESLYLRGAHRGWIPRIAISPQGHLIATVGGFHDETLRLWNIKDFEEVRSLDLFSTDVAFSPDGQYVLTGGSPELLLLDVDTLSKRKTLKGHELPNGDWAGSPCFAFSHDGRFILSGGKDGTIRLWAVESGEQLRCLQHSRKHGVLSVAFSPDGRTFLSGGGGKVHVWNREVGRIICSFDGDWATLSPDGVHALSCSHTKNSLEHTFHLWRLTNSW